MIVDTLTMGIVVSAALVSAGFAIERVARLFRVRCASSSGTHLYGDWSRDNNYYGHYQTRKCELCGFTERREL